LITEVSVVSIAKNESELSDLRNVLSKQTFKDFEFIFSTKRGIPQAWNDVIARAKGKIIVVTESDALPLQNTWLQEMVAAVKKYNRNDPRKRTVVRGIETIPSAWCWCNFASYAQTLKNNRLDESYPVAEDTELFARLKKAGYKGLELPIAPVVHYKNTSVTRLIKNNFRYGILLTKIQMKYGQTGFKSTFKGNNKDNTISVLGRELGMMLSRITFLLGAFVGLIISSFRRK
jgi:GT2 family glycosyltransferase